MKIAMTGTSGNMGREALAQTLELPQTEFVRVLLSPKKKNDKLAKRYRKLYGDRVRVVRGSVDDENVCRELVKGTDYVVHMAAVIPPRSDASFSASEACNEKGAIAMANAVKSCSPQPKYIHVSTVALYGNRNEKHPWGRVGDPLLVSAYDSYAMHKLAGECYLLEAGLDCWAVLRQTAMLYPEMMHDNVGDGLMFHTCLNAPLEWVSSRDSGYLVKRILERDAAGEIPGFWKQIYNVGAGAKSMQTGYDTFKDGFGIIGGSAEKFFKPGWLAARNFHGLWFADGDELQKLFGYQRDNAHDYWQEIARRHKIYKLGKFVPRKLIHLFLFRRLLHHPNSPYRWRENGDEARVWAAFGNIPIPERWEDVKLLARGDFGDYDEMRDVALAKERGLLLDHGYDESKPIAEWDVSDLRSAAAFRGGECLFEGDRPDPYRAVPWRCCEGHVFSLAPFTVLKGGHWCPQCRPSPWNFDRLAEKMPFYAQVWYDSHEKNENVRYDYDRGAASLVRFGGREP